MNKQRICLPLLAEDKSVFLHSLGCAKNLVDSECMSQILRDAGYRLVGLPDAADILVVNTCGFIESAKREAIAAILDLAGYKQPEGKARFLIVAGCLSQRYSKEILKEMPEVDALLGTGDYARIAERIGSLLAGADPSSLPLPGVAGSIEHLGIARELSYPGSYAYIKIAEGCVNRCSYCAIPGIRGDYRSRPIADLVHEAKRLSESGRTEIILIAQDTTRYGADLCGQPSLDRLILEIAAIPTVHMIRVLYAYAAGITDSLIAVMAGEPKVAHYLDLPIQHASDRLLARMNRRDTQTQLRQIIGQLRAAMPDLVLRTTVMVGFPGETDEDFTDLQSFLAEIRFDHLGCFVYSPEVGTAAYDLRPRVKAAVACRRFQAIMEQARQLSAQANQARIGQALPVTLESLDERGIFFVGRSYAQAPEVDPVIYVAASSPDVAIGMTCKVRLVEADDYDMTGVTFD